MPRCTGTFKHLDETLVYDTHVPAAADPLGGFVRSFYGTVASPGAWELVSGTFEVEPERPKAEPLRFDATEGA